MTDVLTRDPATPDLAEWRPADEVFPAGNVEQRLLDLEAEEAREDVADVEQAAKLAGLYDNLQSLASTVAGLNATVLEINSRPDDDIDEEARAEVDAAEVKIATAQQQISSLLSRVSTLESAPPPGGSALGVKTPFSSWGATDAERFNRYFTALRSGWKGEVMFECRRYLCAEQWPLVAGGRCVGTETVAREFFTGTTIEYVGPSGSSLFSLFTNSGYNYPANGVTRDMHFQGIQFHANTDKDLLPPATSWDPKKVLWYCDFHQCTFTGFREVMRYYGTGLNITGCTHFQMYARTPLTLGGSEMIVLTDMSLADTGNAAHNDVDQPFFNCSMSKSVIGVALISARRKAYGLLVSGGHNTKCIGTGFDGPSGDEMTGPAVRFSGSAVDFGLEGCSFKGIKAHAIGCLTGSTQVDVQGCSFKEVASLARCESGFNGVLLWGLNKYENTAMREIRVARGSQIINLDPRVVVKNLDGTLTAVRNPDGTYNTAKKVNADGTTTVVPFP